METERVISRDHDGNKLVMIRTKSGRKRYEVRNRNNRFSVTRFEALCGLQQFGRAREES